MGDAMRRIGLIVSVVSAVAMFPAKADERGFYLGADLGLVASSGMDLTFTPGATAGSEGRLDTNHSTGSSGAAFAGYDFGRIRLETEASYLSADIDKVTSGWSHASGLVAGSQAAGGDLRARSLLLNVVADFGQYNGFSFFVGAGAGRSKIRVSELALPQGGPVLLDDEDSGWRFSWQAVAGTRKALSDNLEVYARYRYFETEDVEMIGMGGRAVSGGLTSHSVTAGLAYRF